MKIESVVLTEFKRFTKLTISNLPESAKLVVVVGPNGSGKSSLFEAFNTFIGRTKNSMNFDHAYHHKMQPLGAAAPVNTGDWSILNNDVRLSFHNLGIIAPQAGDSHAQKAFYIRSSYRNESDFSMSSLQRKNDVLLDENRPALLISPDARVSDNYQRMVAAAIAEIFEVGEMNQTRLEIRDRLIGEVRDAVLRVLPEVEFTGVGDPLADGTFFFKKGSSAGWRYKNLSGGEKAAFDLLLDFIVKKERFDDTVFCIDEPEQHMNTSVQAALLKELYSKVPDSCQLWVSTHSIGMMRQAKEMSEADPGSVVFLDFSGRDYDEPVEIRPAETNRAFWKRTFEVALGDLAELVAPNQLIFCEGSRSSNRNPQFDANCLNQIFSGEFPDTEFVSVGSASEVAKNALLVSSVLSQVLSKITILKLVDRDDLSDAEADEWKGNNGRILSKRHLESYLCDDEILEILCQGLGMADKFQEVLDAKRDAITDSVSRSNAPDDIKSASGMIYNAVKKILGLTKCGNSSEAFCVAMLAPLVTPRTAVYQNIRQDIFLIPII